MVKIFANSGGPDQTPQYAASDLGLHSLSMTLLGVSILQLFELQLIIFAAFIVSCWTDRPAQTM